MLANGNAADVPFQDTSVASFIDDTIPERHIIKDFGTIRTIAKNFARSKSLDNLFSAPSKCALDNP